VRNGNLFLVDVRERCTYKNHCHSVYMPVLNCFQENCLDVSYQPRTDGLTGNALFMIQDYYKQIDEPSTGAGDCQCHKCPEFSSVLIGMWSSSSNDCQCILGYEDDSAGSSQKTCTACGPGKFSDWRGARCEECWFGEYQAESAARWCNGCEEGKYSDTKGASSCASCGDARTTSPPWSSSKGQCGCTDGYFESARTDGLPICTACPAGKYGREGWCRECQLGSYSEAKASLSCEYCERGKYGRADGPRNSSSACESCPSHSSTDGIGANSISDCGCEQGYSRDLSWKPYSSSTGHMMVELTSDESVREYGFEASWSASSGASVSCTGQCECPGTSSANSGTITDGDGDYPNSVECKWTIEAPAGSQVSLQFTSFYTEEGCDYVNVYECASASCDTKSQLARLDGHGVASDSFSCLACPAGSEPVNSFYPQYEWLCRCKSSFYRNSSEYMNVDCHPCPSNARSSESDQSRCLCVEGYTGEDVGYNLPVPSNGACAACEAGKYKDDAGSASCYECPPDHSSDAAATSYFACSWNGEVPMRPNTFFGAQSISAWLANSCFQRISPLASL